MNFYEFKQRQYSQAKSKGTLSLSERLALAKNTIDRRMQREYKSVANYYGHAISNCCSGGMDIVPVVRAYTQSKIAERQERIREVRAMSPTEYFTQIADSESSSLNEYVSSKSEQLIMQGKIMQKIESERGIIIRARKMFNRLDSFAENVSDGILETNSQLNAGMEAIDAWSKMSNDERLEYVVSRFESQQSTSFDKAELDEFSLALLKLGQAKETELTEAESSYQLLAQEDEQ